MLALLARIGPINSVTPALTQGWAEIFMRANFELRLRIVCLMCVCVCESVLAVAKNRNAHASTTRAMIDDFWLSGSEEPRGVSSRLVLSRSHSFRLALLCSSCSALALSLKVAMGMRTMY